MPTSDGRPSLQNPFHTLQAGDNIPSIEVKFSFLIALYGFVSCHFFTCLIFVPQLSLGASCFSPCDNCLDYCLKIVPGSESQCLIYWVLFFLDISFQALSFRDPSTNLCSGDARSWGCALGGKAAPLRGALQRAGGLGYPHSTNGEECSFPRTFRAPGALPILCTQGPSQRLPRKHRGLRPRSCELTLDLSLYPAHPAKSAGPRSIQQPSSCQALHPCLHWSPPEATWKGMALGRAATVAEVTLWS